MPRSLKVEHVGDFYRRKTVPMVRLRGQWFEAAGFAPGERVAITVVSPGVLQLSIVPTAPHHCTTTIQCFPVHPASPT